MSIKFTAYNKQNGSIQYAGTADDPSVLETLDLGILVGEIYESGWIDDENVYHALPAQPSPHHVFDFTAKQWVDPRTPETEWQLVREKRNRLLAASDWTQLPDVPLATKEAWAVYRQELRDVTLQPDPFNIVWPTTPV